MEACPLLTAHLPQEEAMPSGLGRQVGLLLLLWRDRDQLTQSHSHQCVTPWTVARQAPLSMGFSRQEYWSGLPCPSPGDLPNPGIQPAPSPSHCPAASVSSSAPSVHRTHLHNEELHQSCYTIELESRSGVNYIYNLCYLSLCET